MTDETTPSPGSLADLQKSIKDVQIETVCITDRLRSEKLASLGLFRNRDLLADLQLALYDIACVAAAMCNTDIALVTFVDDETNFIKAGYCPGRVPGTCNRDDSFCNITIQSSQLLIVEDSLKDSRFDNNPNAESTRFYVGAPLITKDGVILGALCVIDTQPRKIDDITKYQKLTNLARLVIDVLTKDRILSHTTV